MGFRPFAGLLPPTGVGAFPGVRSLVRTIFSDLVGAFAIVWRLPPVRAHVPLAARPRPTVSVGGSTELIGFAKPLGRSRICDATSGLRSRLRSAPAAVRLLRRADPALGFVASLRVLRDDRRVFALATRTLSPSVACRATCRTAPSRTGRVRRSWTNLDIRPARPPLDPSRAAVVCV